MSKIPEKPNTNDKQLFSDTMSDITLIKQDKNIPFSDNNCVFIARDKPQINEKVTDTLSDEYGPFELEEQKYDLNFHQQCISKKQFLSLRKNYFDSEQVLDLHGLNRQQAREQLLEFFHYCNKRNFTKVTIMPGYGKGILRQSMVTPASPGPCICRKSSKVWWQGP